MLNSQLMLVSPGLLIGSIVAAVLACVAVVGVVVKTVKKQKAKKQNAKNNQVAETPKEEAAKAPKEELKKEATKKLENPAPSKKAAPKISNDKSDLVGETKVVKGDFEKDSAYNWVYKLKFTKDSGHNHTLSWKTTSHDSMQKALMRDLKYSFMKRFDGADNLDVKVKYQTENGVKYFEKIYNMTTDAEAQSKIKKELLDVVIDISQNKVEPKEEIIVM